MSPYRESARREPRRQPTEPSPWPAVAVVLVACPLLVVTGRELRWGLGALLVAFVGAMVAAMLRSPHGEG